MTRLPEQQVTLNLLLKQSNGRLLEVGLAMKKRGFGVGRWNGVGGKLQTGETVEQAIIRETREEIGVTMREYYKTAVIHFYFSHQPGWDQTMHVFVTTKWDGEPTESEEMKPAWFAPAKIPYNQMWPDDPLWLPAVLNGKFVRASFTFAPGDKILAHQVVVSELELVH